MQPIEFHGLLREVKQYRIGTSGDLEARAWIIFRPLDKGNDLAVAKLSKIQEEEQEIKVSVAIDNVD